jgi:A/G-specific adenine glycosylase
MGKEAQGSSETKVAWKQAGWLRAFRQRLLRWYRQHRRDLPWRATDDPYAIWVSEIMLQQTQVATVLDYYARFLQRFPDIRALAMADEQAVLRAWEGLGYYRRARQLHAAAQRLLAEHAGEFPSDFASILGLPGIGRYTAGAIASFAFQQPTPIVEANTQRLYARLMQLSVPLDKAEGQAALWSFAERIVQTTDPRSLNQAVMELGALVCLPQPRCDVCPLQPLCPTFAAGMQSSIPLAKKKMDYEPRCEIAFLVKDRRQRLLVRRCLPGEWWAGLWDFPRLTLPPRLAFDQPFDTWSGTLQPFEGTEFRLERHLFTIKHAVTKYRIQLACFTAAIAKPRSGTRLADHLRWIDPSELAELPLSSSGRKMADRLQRSKLA